MRRGSSTDKALSLANRLELEGNYTDGISPYPYIPSSNRSAVKDQSEGYPKSW